MLWYSRCAVLIKEGEEKREKTKMSGYRLYYFPIRGRGEIARWAFAVAKIDFDDVRLSDEEWAKEKACKYKN